MQRENSYKRYLVWGTGVLLCLFYLVGCIYPESFWAVHFAAFMLPSLQILLGVAVIFFAIVFPLIPIPDKYSVRITELFAVNSKVKIVLISVLMGSAFYAFPVIDDPYGDAPFLVLDKEYSITNLTEKPIPTLWSFDFTNPKLGTGTTVGAIGLLSYISNQSVYDVFRWWDVFWGMGFVFIWLLMTTKFVTNLSWKIALDVIGLTAPFLLNYFGRTEVYGNLSTAILGYLFLLCLYFRYPGKKYLIFSVLVFIVCLKFHITSLLLLPSLFLALFHYYTTKRGVFSHFFTLANMIKWVLIPVHLAGAIIYFFVTKSFFGPRSFTEDTLDTVVFLPVFSPEPAPLDRYNLFSGTHFFDYLNLLFLWSPAALFLIIAIAVLYRNEKPVHREAILVVGTTLVIYASFYFVLNPILSMPQDWDLFSVPGVVLLVFAMMLASKVKTSSIPRPVLGLTIALSIFSLSIFYVNANSSALGNRLIDKAMWEFKTYWIGSSTSFKSGLRLSENNSEEPIRLLSIIENLEPFAIPGNDVEYAGLLNEMGNHYVESAGDYQQAIFWYKKAETYSPNLCLNIYRLLTSHFMLGEFQHANKYCRNLVSCRYPSHKKSLKMAIHTSLEAKSYINAQHYCEEYLKMWPDDKFINNVHKRLLSGERLDEIQLLFRQK